MRLRGEEVEGGRMGGWIVGVEVRGYNKVVLRAFEEALVVSTWGGAVVLWCCDEEGILL